MAREVAAPGAARKGDRGAGLVQDEVRGRLALPAVAVGVLAVSAAILGNALALVAAITVAIYVLIGRSSHPTARRALYG